MRIKEYKFLQQYAEDIPDDSAQNFEPEPKFNELVPLASFQEKYPALPTLPVDALPDWLGAYCRQLAAEKQAPQDIAVMLSLAVLATVFQSKVFVAPFGKDDNYKEPVCLWTLVIAKPGERKTPILEALRRPLVRWHMENRDSMRQRISEDKVRRNFATAQLKELETSAKKEPPSSSVLEEMTRLQIFLDQPPVIEPMLWTSDVTPEALQNLLVDHDERMAVLADEGGIFQTMSGLYSGGQANIDVFLQAWSGSPVRVKRGSREAMLDNPLLTFGLAVQPKIMQDLIKAGDRMRGVGLLARFLFCIPESLIGTRTIKNRIPRNPQIEDEYNNRILGALSLDIAQDPLVFTLSSGALECYTNFAQSIEDELGDGGAYSSIQDWGAKLAGQSLRIAGLLHAAEVLTATGAQAPSYWAHLTEIPEATVKNAISLCNPLIDHARAALAPKETGTEAIKDAEKVLEIMGKRQSMSKRDIQRSSPFSTPTTGVSRLMAAIRLLVDAGYIHLIDGNTLTKNPKIENSKKL